MKSVKENTNTLIIKNSKFITYIYPVNTIEEIQTYLNKTKNKYPDATHHCYAYILDQNRKENDDGEPSGTAGLPILQVLEKKELNHVLCIVIRYFGKIKLGAGGLVRAYSKSASECLKEHVCILEEGYLCNITFTYEESKKIDHLLKDTIIKDKIYDNQITYQTYLSKTKFEQLKLINEITITDITPTYLPSREDN